MTPIKIALFKLFYIQQMKKIIHFFYLLFIKLLIALNLLNCQAGLQKETTHSPVKVINNSLSVTFSADGTLWRLLPASDFVYVDASKDKGISYSKAVKVNRQAQKISAWPENTPTILVTKKGRILVLYYADEQQKSTSYLSYSDDSGQTFSPPVLLSDKAKTDMHYMDKMLIDNQGKVHFFWHDMRDEDKNKSLGSGVLSLYHAETSTPEAGAFKNELITHAVCSCCRTAISVSPNNQPVILLRKVFADRARDHVLLKQNQFGQWRSSQSIANDHWVIEACPEHGPALVIDNQGKSHMVWFTLGDTRQGIFYAQTDDYGEKVSRPMAIGRIEFLPSHPDVIVVNNRVILSWTEFDGKTSMLFIQQSLDRGSRWQTARQVLNSSSTAGYPVLLSHNNHIFVSWVTKKEGHRFIEVENEIQH